MAAPLAGDQGFDGRRIPPTGSPGCQGRRVGADPVGGVVREAEGRRFLNMCRVVPLGITGDDGVAGDEGADGISGEIGVWGIGGSPGQREGRLSDRALSCGWRNFPVSERRDNSCRHSAAPARKGL